MNRKAAVTIPSKSLWESRMLTDQPAPMEIGHYYPVIGRGNIAHATISHEEVERELDHAFSRSLKEWLFRLMDW